MDVLDLPGKPSGTVSKIFLPSPSTETGKDLPVTLVAPCEVDKGEDRRECWVSGCRANEALKKCELYPCP